MNAENTGSLKPVPTSATPLAVDLPEAAHMLGVCTETIRREINRGRLRAFKIGRVWRVRITELNAYMKALENQGADT